MSAHLNRAQLLYHQSRFDMAADEVRRTLAENPHDATAHSLLGLCLMRQDKLKEATSEVEQAIVLAPDDPYTHFCRSIVLEHRKRYVDAEVSAREAIRLDPENAHYYSQLGVVQFRKKQWNNALATSLEGLQRDAEHSGCNNLRSMALTQLGRQAESIATVDQSLAKDPDDEMAHANKGWALLHQGKPRPALEHFREALRLDPNYEYAQFGTVEALKACNPIYRWLLAYFLWMSRQDERVKWGVILGGYFVARSLRVFSRNYPEMAPWTFPLLALYMLFVIMTWFAVPFFNLLLRLNKFGRHVLNREQRVSSNWFFGCLLVCVVGLSLGFVTGHDIWFLVGGYGIGLALPLVTIYNCEEGWPRKAFTALAAGMAVVGALAIGAEALQLEIVHPLIVVFLLGFIASPWLANYLAGVTVQK